MTLAKIPDEIDITASWLVEYWASQLGVSTSALIQAVGIVGPEVSKLRKYLKDGRRISIIDDDGVERLVARIGILRDGFHLSVPYHPAKEGLLVKTPLDYSKKENVVPFSDMEMFTVSDHVKLSMHMTGFVQFSSLGRKIISGFNPALQQIKGVGVRAPDVVDVTTGPLCGIIVQGLAAFDANNGKPGEVFAKDDYWHNPLFSSPGDTALHLEFFMFGRNELPRARIEDTGKRIFQRQLPFNGKFEFLHHLRVIEIPRMPFFLGLIVSCVTPDDDIESGFKIAGPGCFDKSGNAYEIAAWYPWPSIVHPEDAPSLDYE